MYSKEFCNVYNEFGWNYFPEAFGEQLLAWIRQRGLRIQTSLDLACGTGVLCEILHQNGIRASGMDLSEGMIAIARERCPAIPYEVADMVRYCPDRSFDLVTCTGDALNHIIDLRDVGQIFRNVFRLLNPGGYFLFDLLDEAEIPDGEPIDLDFSDDVRSRFQVTRGEDGIVTLQTSVFTGGRLQFEERIQETVHDREKIQAMLVQSGFLLEQCSHQLLAGSADEAATWYVIAKKPLGSGEA